MKFNMLTEKTILALFIVIFGMVSIVFLDLKDTTENSIVNLIIMVVSFYFGSSAAREQKEKFENMIKDAIADAPIDGGGDPNDPKKKP